MTGSLLTSDAADYVALWRDYWGTRWHHPVPWPAHRLSCFITADLARNNVSREGDALVMDYPTGRRPFLGVLTNGADGKVSAASGAMEYNDNGHLLTIAPTRAGKGVGQIIPNLLLYAGSCLVIDIKGENHKITHQHRAKFFEDASVFKFAPFDDDTMRYNPLDFIRVDRDGRATSYTFDDARLVSEMLIGNRSNDPFWETEARGLCTMLLYYVATYLKPGEYERAMSHVIDLLFPPSIDETDKTPFTRSVVKMLNWATMADDNILAAMVTQFQEHEDKVRQGILSTCRGALAIWLSPRLQLASQVSDFRFSDLKRSMCRPEAENPAPTTLYIVIPPEYLKEYRPVLRMMTGLAAVELTRPNDWATPEKVADGWSETPPCPVLFLLDEFPALGYMAPIAEGVAYLAGYGVQIWTFSQSLGQLKEIYKENWSTFISNAGASCFFGMTDPELCEYLAGQLGKTGEYPMRYFTASETESSSTGSGSSRSWAQSGSQSTTSDNWSDGVSRTIAQQIRFKDDPVATASDLRAMPSGAQIVLLRHTLPALVSLLPYLECELFTSLYDAWRP
jgi:type IV secretion system protein VirD4